MKKVYFACSIAGGRDHAHVYQDIVDNIKVCGMHVLSEIFADQTLKSETGTKHKLTPHDVWKWDLDWVREADAIIAEVTQPSLGVGYEIAKAEQWNKPVLALFNKSSGNRLSPMVAGDPNVTVHEYESISETREVFRHFLDRL